MDRILFTSLALIFLFTTGILADSGIIKGRIVDSETKDALPGANVAIIGTNMGAATDLRGNYIIGNIPPGEYTLKVTYIGYKSHEITVQVVSGSTIVQDIDLIYGQVVEGKLVVVTAQASGQYEAINQQLRSNTIANVVSEARIQELPDVNAAESIGRLPGVAIDRSGGEATRVSIRGLSPKYNTVTVNGVRLPGTGGDDRGVSLSDASDLRTGGNDRSVDLSLISSNMLDGIEVKKAITPDMDADAIGGTVDLKLREAPENLIFNVTAQGGYNQLQDYYGNYNFTGNVSNRFYNNRFGVMASFNADKYDRSADKFYGDYRQQTIVGSDETEIVARSISVREENVTRGRIGASLLLDYRIPLGKVTANSFYNRVHWDGLYRINRMNVNDNRHYYDLEDRGGTTSVFTGALGVEQDFGWIRYDASVSGTASRTETPEERTWTFVQEANAFEGQVTADTHPNEIPALATNDSNKTALQSAYIWDANREENQAAVQFNVEMPFRLSRQINAYIKVGGKFRWLDRMNDEEQRGRDAMQYGNNNGPNATLRAIDERIPEWGIEEYVNEYGLLPIWIFTSDYNRPDFLSGEYPLGYTVDKGMMDRLTDALFDSPEALTYAIGSRGRDYDGIERYQAGYIMAGFNFGKYVTLLPGIRWEKDYSKYHGQRYREVTRNNIQQEPTDLDSLTVEREHDFWLPMVHLIVNPVHWLKVRLARTETLTRPDFIQYAPITRINSYQTYVRAANSLLKPAHSTNWDASISVYQNHLGLFTVSGFYKSIKDLIFQTNYYLRTGLPVLEGLNIPESWIEASPDCDTYINNPFEATYKGFEIDWQTHFWYLPSIFRGLVLNVNYTRIFSETQKQLFYLGQGELIWERPPVYETIIIDSSRTARMPDQPAHILNVTLGYDYKGFSARLSYLYQTDKLTYLDRKPVLDNFSGAYARWDLTLQQNIGWGLQCFANFTNLNKRSDQNYRGDALEDPSYIEYYGFTMDAGIRYRFY
jgi:TonB-dependent receptor